GGVGRVAETVEREVVGRELRVGRLPVEREAAAARVELIARAVVGARVEVARRAGLSPVAAGLHGPEQRLAQLPRRSAVPDEPLALEWRGDRERVQRRELDAACAASPRSAAAGRLGA